MFSCSICKETKSINEFYERRDRPRGVSSRCRSCSSKKRKESYLKNIEKHRAARKISYLRNAESIKRRTRQYYKKNTEKCRLDARSAYRRNPEKIKQRQRIYSIKNREKRIAYLKNWKKLNPEYMQVWSKSNRYLLRLYQVKRATRTAQATPPWADQQKIKEIYRKACSLTEETGIRHEVDHIVPLQNPYVCGLHIPENLQILTAAENRKKNNRFAC